jgi:peptidoglycan hydrolase-like protein with peptidoglycan-binding domain
MLRSRGSHKADLTSEGDALKSIKVVLGAVGIVLLSFVGAGTASATTGAEEANSYRAPGIEYVDVAGPSEPYFSTLSVGTCTKVTQFSTAGKKVDIPTTASGNRDCRLEQGNLNNAVKRLQQDLKNGCNGNPVSSLATDGDFGPATKTALRNAQSLNGLTADGIYGSQTASNWWWLTTDKTQCVHLGL